MPDDALSPLGLDRACDTLYRVVLRFPGEAPQTLGQLVGWSLDEVLPALERLVALNLVRRADDVVVPEPPGPALATLVQRETRRLAAAQARLTAARMTVPELLAEHHAGRLGHPDASGDTGIEIISAAHSTEAFIRLIVETTGDLWHLRPDQWALPGTELSDATLIRELAGGRVSRALYPVAALQPVRPGVRARVDAGELVRVLPDVPSRLIVFGTEAALMTERWGSPGGSRLVLRQSGIVLALRELAQTLWDYAVSPPELATGTGTGTGTGNSNDGARGQAQSLLSLMARGAADEQIARTLALSVRTVRRRIAALLAELGADSRFQAGVEAVRRGWI